MGDLLLRKVVLCRSRMAKIRAALPQDPSQIAADEKVEAFIAFNLFLLIQDAVDLAAHLISEHGLGVPGSLRDTFAALAKEGILSGESATTMAQMGSLRNRIAHAYGDLDPVRMAREVPAGLDAVGRFLDEITSRE